MHHNPYAAPDAPAPGPKRKAVVTALRIALLLVILSPLLYFLSIPVFGTYADWRAEKDATAFCAAIDIGSDISVAIAAANKEGLRTHYWADDKSGYSFVFMGFFTDNASCDVKLDQGKYVTSTHSQMYYD